MKNLRKIEEGKLERSKVFIPMTFNDMLNYLHKAMQHESIKSEIIGADVGYYNKDVLE